MDLLIEKRRNRYDVFLVLLISSLAFCNVGGALQISRLLAILLTPTLLSKLHTCDRSITKVRDFLGLILLYLFFSLLWSFNQMRGVEELIYYGVHFILFLEMIVFARFSNQPIHSIALGWTISVAMTLVVAIWEITTDNHLSYSQQEAGLVSNFGHGIVVDHRFASVTFYNYNSYVTFLCFALPFLYHRLKSVYKENFREKVLMITVIALSIVCIIYNASRGGMISLFVISLLYLFSNRSLKSSIKSLIFFIAIIGVVFFVFRNDILTAFMARMAVSGSVGDESRWPIWQNGLRLLQDTYGFGPGVGGLTTGMERYAKGGITITHNMILELFLQFGSVFALIILSKLWKLYKNLLKGVYGSLTLLMKMILFSLPIIAIIDSGYFLSPHFYAYCASIMIVSSTKYLNLQTDKL